MQLHHDIEVPHQQITEEVIQDSQHLQLGEDTDSDGLEDSIDENDNPPSSYTANEANEVSFNDDDRDEAMPTLRTVVAGLGFVVLATQFSFRMQAISVSAFLFQPILFVIGQVLEKAVPDPGSKYWKNNVFWRFMNPGPLSWTEQVIIAGEASGGLALAVSLCPVFASDLFHYIVAPGSATFTLVVLQMMGYAVAELLVYPRYMHRQNAIYVNHLGVLHHLKGGILQGKWLQISSVVIVGLASMVLSYTSLRTDSLDPHGNSHRLGFGTPTIVQWSNILQGVEDHLGSVVDDIILSEFSRDHVKMTMLAEMMKYDVAEDILRGAIEQQHILRKQQELEAIDKRAMDIKNEGNALFRQGLHKDAYVLYTACIKLAPHGAVYFLNRAAAALQLGMYHDAVLDATVAIHRGFMPVKARYRRGRAYRLSGDLKRAARDLKVAAKLEPYDLTLKEELAELSILQAMSDEELRVWVGAQRKTRVFESDEDDKLLGLVDERLSIY